MKKILSLILLITVIQSCYSIKEHQKGYLISIERDFNDFEIIKTESLDSVCFLYEKILNRPSPNKTYLDTCKFLECRYNNISFYFEPKYIIDGEYKKIK